MSFAIGFGAMGEIVAVGSLIKNISRSLSDHNGSAAKYQSLIDNLRILGDAVGQVDLVFRNPQRAHVNEGLFLVASNSVKLVEGSLQVSNTRLQKFNPGLGVHGSGNRFKNAKRKIEFMLSEEEIEAAKREILQSTLVLKLLVETTVLCVVEHNHDGITEQLALIRDQTHETRRDIEARSLTLQDMAKRLGQEVLRKISFLTQTVLDIKSSVSHIASAVLSISTELATLRALLPAMQQSPSDEHFLVEDALGRIFPIHFRTITSWAAFFFILCERFKGERGARRVQLRRYKLLDSSSNQGIFPDTQWEKAFLPHQKIVMSLLCRGAEVSDADDYSLTTCPRCNAQSGYSTNMQVQCHSCNMYYTRVIAVDHPARFRANTESAERQDRSHKEMETSDIAESFSRSYKRSRNDSSSDKNSADGFESDDEDISGLVRVTIVSRKKRTKTSRDVSADCAHSLSKTLAIAPTTSEALSTTINTLPNLDARPGLFPCEFPGCIKEFQDSEQELWIQHQCAHITAEVQEKVGFPRKTRCWFCNKTFERTFSNMDCNLKQLFKQRLAHIAMHILENPGRIQPDWWFFDYLVTNGLVPHEVVSRVNEFHEVPFDMIMGKVVPRLRTGVEVEVMRSSPRSRHRNRSAADKSRTSATVS